MVIILSADPETLLFLDSVLRCKINSEIITATFSASEMLEWLKFLVSLHPILIFNAKCNFAVCMMVHIINSY